MPAHEKGGVTSEEGVAERRTNARHDDPDPVPSRPVPSRPVLPAPWVAPWPPPWREPAWAASPSLAEVIKAGVVAKLLHGPTVRLKDAAGTVAAELYRHALIELFDLDSTGTASQ